VYFQDIFLKKNYEALTKEFFVFETITSNGDKFPTESVPKYCTNNVVNTLKQTTNGRVLDAPA
jgi:hypothetical protein